MDSRFGSVQGLRWVKKSLGPPSAVFTTHSPALPEPLMKLLDGLLEPIPAKRITLAKAETLAGDKAAWSLPVYRGLSTASQMPMPKLRARWKAAVPQYDDENEDL